MTERRITIRVLPGLWQGIACTCILMGAIAGLGHLGSDWPWPPVPSLLGLWLVAGLILWKVRRSLHARIEADALIIRAGGRAHRYPLGDLEYVLERHGGPDGWDSLHLVMQDGRRVQLLSDGPVSDFGAAIGDLAKIPFMRVGDGPEDVPHPHPDDTRRHPSAE